MQSKLLVVAPIVALLGLLGLVGTANAACAVQPPGICCTSACPTFSPCWFQTPCNAPPPPPVDVLKILSDIFVGIKNIFTAIEATLPQGSPALNVVAQVFDGINNIFTSVSATLGGRRKRAYGKDDECEVEPDGYGYASKKHEGKLGHKSAKAANEALKAIKGIDEESGKEITKLVEEVKGKSAEDRRKAYRKAVENKKADSKEKVDKVLDAYSKTLEDAKEGSDKYLGAFSADAKKAGGKLMAIVLDEKLTPEEKEKQIDEHYGTIKPEVKKELGLRDIAFIKRACGIASCPFATLGNYRVPMKLEF